MQNRYKHRIVVDSNILVSALVYGGKPRQVIELVLEDATLIMSAEILSKLRRVVYSKFPAFIDEVERLELLLKRDAIFVELGSVVVTESRDPDDNMVIETAIIGECSFVVSGDKDLLTLSSYKEIAIVSPADFLSKLSN